MTAHGWVSHSEERKQEEGSLPASSSALIGRRNANVSGSEDEQTGRATGFFLLFFLSFPLAPVKYADAAGHEAASRRVFVAVFGSADDVTAVFFSQQCRVPLKRPAEGLMCLSASEERRGEGEAGKRLQLSCSLQSERILVLVMLSF